MSLYQEGTILRVDNRKRHNTIIQAPHIILKTRSDFGIEFGICTNLKIAS